MPLNSPSQKTVIFSPISPEMYVCIYKTHRQTFARSERETVEGEKKKESIRLKYDVNHDRKTFFSFFRFHRRRRIFVFMEQCLGMENDFKCIKMAHLSDVECEGNSRQLMI